MQKLILRVGEKDRARTTAPPMPILSPAFRACHRTAEEIRNGEHGIFRIKFLYHTFHSFNQDIS